MHITVKPQKHMPKTTHTIPHIELCLWYSEAIQGQETDSRRIVLYTLIFPSPSPSNFWTTGAQEINFKLAFSSLLKWCHLWTRPGPGETKKNLVSGRGVSRVTPYTTVGTPKKTNPPPVPNGKPIILGVPK